MRQTDSSLYDRLLAILEYDRGVSSLDINDALREDVLNTMERYLDIDREYAQINLEMQEVPGLEADMALVAYVPVFSSRTPGIKTAEQTKKEDLNEPK